MKGIPLSKLDMNDAMRHYDNQGYIYPESSNSVLRVPLPIPAR